MRGAALLPIVLIAAAAQQPAPPVEFICPMDPDVRSTSPGKCPRCGMPLEAGIQEPLKYRLRLERWSSRRNRCLRESPWNCSSS